MKAIVSNPGGPVITAVDDPHPGSGEALVAIQAFSVRVLVTGANGGVGRIQIQLAALAGAEVTAVARPQHEKQLLALGASSVVADPARGWSATCRTHIRSHPGRTLPRWPAWSPPGGSTQLSA